MICRRRLPTIRRAVHIPTWHGQRTRQGLITGKEPMAEEPGRLQEPPSADDVDAVTSAVLAASSLLMTISARSLASVEERVTLQQFRMLVVLAGHGDLKLVSLADRL